jgi:hypothetical protein
MTRLGIIGRNLSRRISVSEEASRGRAMKTKRRHLAASRTARWIVLLVGIGLLPAQPAGAVDLHAFWDSRCGTCHGHAADFARQFLSVEDGKLLGRHHRDDLKRFLANHYLPAELIDPVTAMMAAQVAAMPRFKTQCGGCHASAAALVREGLVIRDGTLVARKSGRPIDAFLAQHDGAEADTAFFTNVLMRVAREIGLR